MAKSTSNAAPKFLAVVQDKRKLTFKLGNGLKVEFDAGAVHADIIEAAMMHGFKQKIADSAAGCSKSNDFAGAFAKLQATADRLQNTADWNAKGGSGNSDLAQAIANLKGIELDAAVDAIAALDDEQLGVLMSKPKVKAEILRIKMERAQAQAGDDDDLGI